MVKKITSLHAEEKAQLMEHAYERHGKKCYVCLREIDLGSADSYKAPHLHENPSLDHIDPKANLGPKAEEFDNYAVAHIRCNTKKGTMGLDLARAIIWLEDVKEKHPQTYLSHVQQELEITPKRVQVKKESGGRVNLHFGQQVTLTCQVYQDPRLPGCEYFYAQVPLEYIAHDDELQPRPLGDQIDRFLRGMHRQPILDVGHSRLTVDDQGYGQINLWNAQHRAVVAYLTDRKTLDLKIYLNPSDRQITILRSANTDAHTTLKQVASPTPNAAMRYAAIFQDAWESFMANETVPKKSEQTFIESQPDAETKKKFRQLLEKHVITDRVLRAHDDNDFHGENKISDYVDYNSTRSSKFLFTYNSLQKDLLSRFAHLNPLDVDLVNVDPDDDPRLIERDNLVKLLNYIVEELLESKWKKDRLAKIVKNNPVFSEHNSAVMITRPVAMQVWGEVLRDSIVKTCTITGSNIPSDTPDNQKLRDLLLSINNENVFLKPLTENIWNSIRKMIQKLGNHQIWKNPNDRVLTVLSGNTYEPAKTLIRNGMLDETKFYEHPLDDSYLLSS